MNSQLTPLGILIRTLRQNKGTTLYRMAKAIDLSPAQICAIEFGRAELTDAQAVNFCGTDLYHKYRRRSGYCHCYFVIHLWRTFITLR